MPDEVIRKTIPELTAGAIIQGSLFENAQPNVQSSTGYNSVKVTADDVSNYVATTKTYSQLQTTSKTLVSAINEAAQSGGGASVVQKTMAEYTALPTSEKMNGSIYKITDKALIYCLDEEFHALKEITSADYAQLTPAEKNNGTIYVKTDEETTAADIPYAAGVSVADKIDDIYEKIALETLTNKITPTQGVTLEIISLYKQGNMAFISFVLRIPNISGTILTFTDIFPTATAYNTVKDNDNVVPYLKIERTSTGGRLATDVTKTTNGLVIGEIIFVVD